MFMRRIHSSLVHPCVRSSSPLKAASLQPQFLKQRLTRLALGGMKLVEIEAEFLGLLHRLEGAVAISGLHLPQRQMEPPGRRWGVFGRLLEVGQRLDGSIQTEVS